MFYNTLPTPREYIRLYTPSGPPKPPWEGGGLGYPKMKIEIIFEIHTIEHPKIDISLSFMWYRILPLQTPPGGALWGPEGVPVGRDRLDICRGEIYGQFKKN